MEEHPNDLERRVGWIDEIGQTFEKMTAETCVADGQAIRRRMLRVTKDMADAADWIDEMQRATEFLQVTLLVSGFDDQPKAEGLAVLERLKKAVRGRFLN